MLGATSSVQFLLCVKHCSKCLALIIILSLKTAQGVWNREGREAVPGSIITLLTSRRRNDEQTPKVQMAHIDKALVSSGSPLQQSSLVTLQSYHPMT